MARKKAEIEKKLQEAEVEEAKDTTESKDAEEISGEQVLEDAEQIDKSLFPKDNDIPEVEANNEETEAAETEETYSSVSVDNRSVMSERMAVLFNGAAYQKEILTGTLTGANIKKYGCVATVTYKGDRESITVQIQADKMGLDNVSIRNKAMQYIRQNNLPESQLERQIVREQRTMLTNMLGAKVDFIPLDVLRDMGVVIGDRQAAMERKRQNFSPSRYNAAPLIKAGYRGMARILMVTQKYLLVELSGYVGTMRIAEVSPMAMDLKDEFRTGEDLPVTVVKIENGKVYMRGTRGLEVNYEAKIREYHKGDRVYCEVIRVNYRTGHYYLAMPNGSRGIAYYSKSEITNPPKEGDFVYALVVGRTQDGRAVRLDLRKIR